MYIRKALSLIEIMICLVILSMVGVVLVRNVKSSLNEARAFRSVEGAKHIVRVLEMSTTSSTKSGEKIAENWEQQVLSSPFGLKKDIFNDGWGNKYEVSYDGSDGFAVRSSAYEDFLKAKSGEDVDDNKYWQD